jgi:hypothetical protein
MKDKKHIDKLFAQRLTHRKKPVPPQMWERIEQSLDKKKKIIPLWLKGVAAAMALFILFQWGLYREIFDFNKPVASSKVVIGAKNISGSPHTDKISTNTNKISIQGKEKKSPKTKKPKKKVTHIPKTNLSPKSHSQLKESVLPKKAKTVEKTSTYPPINKLNNKIAYAISVPTATIAILHKTLKLDRFENHQTDENTELYTYTGSETKTKRKMEVGMSLAPNYTYRNIIGITEEGVALGEYYDQQENGLRQYAAQAEINYDISDRFSFQTGIAYNTFGFRDKDALSYYFKDNTLYLRDIENSVANYAVKQDDKMLAINASSGFAMERKGEGAEPKDGVLTQEFAYIQIPMSVGFSLARSEKFHSKLIGGMSPGYLIREKSNLIYDGHDIPIQEYGEYNKKIISGLVGFAVQYRITRHLNFKVQPMLNYSFVSIINNEMYKVQPYSWNIFGGIHYHF